MADEQAAAQQNAPQQQFSLQRIYCKDVSFESPATPEIFRKSYQPKVNVDLNTKSNAIDENGNFEVVLTITVTSKVLSPLLNLEATSGSSRARSWSPA